ncbi:MAG: cytochrome c maturation protein CcmE [Calditrichaeota bacterium]|nr:cytochrome c maturation protein CcmE [Calditrichota bacterium]
MGIRKKYIVGFIVILITFGFLVYRGMDGAMMVYVNVSELDTQDANKENETLQVAGIVEPGSIESNSSTRQISFMLQDLNKPDYTLKVNYNGIVPDNFKPGIQVVVQGVLDQKNKVIKAEQILVKCPSKYQEDTKS